MQVELVFLLKGGKKMTINQVSQIGLNSLNTKNETNSRSSLSVDDFLQIMAAEIRNQNPMGSDSSGSNTDYISQLAQFTTLEQITSMAESISLLTLMNQQQYSFSLIGREVTIEEGDITIRGIVESVKFQNGIAVLKVNGDYYYLGSVTEVRQKEVE